MDKKRKEQLEAIREYAEIEYDKLIVLLSSGALAVTLGLFENVKGINTSGIRCLHISWIFFSITLIIVLLSHISSKISVDLEIKNKDKSSDVFDLFTHVLNYVAFATLIAGFIFLTIYIS